MAATTTTTINSVYLEKTELIEVEDDMSLRHSSSPTCEY
ncbi:minor histocompatibility protein HB-1 [Urocitellus parryii]